MKAYTSKKCSQNEKVMLKMQNLYLVNFTNTLLFFFSDQINCLNDLCRKILTTIMLYHTSQQNDLDIAPEILFHVLCSTKIWDSDLKHN